MRWPAAPLDAGSRPRVGGAGARFATGTVAGHPYVRYGSGEPLVVVAGLNDPLMRVTDALWFVGVVAAYCRRCARKFDRAVHFVSRPAGIPAGTTTREMARGYAEVAERLGPPVDLLGLSMGGFLVAHLAADRPDLVDRAVFGLAAARLSDHGRATVRQWGRWAAAGEWVRVYRAGVDAVSVGPLRRVGHAVARAYATLSSEPPTAGDFGASVRACLAHDATPRLVEVEAPALVVGGTRDPFFTVEEFRATARGLDAAFARLDGAGHEAVVHRPRAFDAPIAAFLRD